MSELNQPTKHELDEVADQPTTKKLKTTTLDSFLIKLPKEQEPTMNDNIPKATPQSSITPTGVADQPAAVAAAAQSDQSPAQPKLDQFVETAGTAAGPTEFDPQSWLSSLPMTASNANAPSTRDLLALEAATIDPSWLVLVKEELTKHYFLALKKYLWTEGVRGTEIKGDKVYPPGQHFPHVPRHSSDHSLPCPMPFPSQLRTSTPGVATLLFTK